MSRLALFLAFLLFASLVSANVHVSVDVESSPRHHNPHHKAHHEIPHHMQQEESEAEVDMAKDLRGNDSNNNLPVVGGGAPVAPVEAASVAQGGKSINHGAAGNHIGLDVSHYDGTITNFKGVVDTLRKQGGGADPWCIQKVSEGSAGLDNTAAHNIPGFMNAGCLTGIYHFMRVSAGVDKQVALMLNNRHGAKYVVLDAELDERGAGPMAKAIIDKLATHEIKTILYTSAGLAQKWGARKWSVPLWIARYSSTKPAFGDLWQYTESGRITGVPSKVDLSRPICTKARFEEIFY